MRLCPRLACLAVLAVAAAGVVAQPLKLRVDLTRTNGVVRPLHGINKGPIATGGMIDLTEPQRELHAPFARLHDCQWPYPEVVDFHSIFRDPAADPERPGSYDFLLTDAYLATIRQTGARIVYRLGESIEHGTVKRFVHPPTDYDRWAAACVGIVRHYNDGWAGGQHYDIPYWEIWNEPDVRPQMWSGTDDDYFRLYRVTARAIKARFQGLRVGGPAAGNSGGFTAHGFVPSEFVTNFLASCRRDNVPLDFFSWHCYTTDPSEPARRARAIRRVLDAAGFTNTESHLNEWNYLPGNTWEPFGKSAAPETRQGFYEEMGGAAGAAFVATALIELEDAPVDVCNFYHGEVGPFGLFNEYGVPKPVFYAMRAFSQLAALSHRLPVEGGIPGKLAVLGAANLDRTRALILIGNWQAPASEISLELAGCPPEAHCRIWIIDTHQSWREDEGVQPAVETRAMRLILPSPGVALVEVRH